MRWVQDSEKYGRHDTEGVLSRGWKRLKHVVELASLQDVAENDTDPSGGKANQTNSFQSVVDIGTDHGMFGHSRKF